MKSMLAFFKENRGFVLFIFLMLIFRSSCADWNVVPTGSMKPTILEGDRIWVNKMAYDLRFPFTLISLYRIADPERGDIVVFDSDAADERLVKRVIGVPGDIVELKNNRLYINGESARYSGIQEVDGALQAQEQISGFSHRMQVYGSSGRAANFGPVTVPAGHYLVLGDNRDNSADSRFIGFVPRREIVGRSGGVVISLNYDNYYLPRTDRFLQEF
ncbi:MAG TPA: signal peptidase I [Gammaproteobacteria bacterium]|nr:signal peptidase I [Gammaproteobacteria bacterium]